MTTQFLPLTVWYDNNISIPGFFITALVALLVHSQQQMNSLELLLFIIPSSWSRLKYHNNCSVFPWGCLGSGSTACWTYSEGLWGDFFFCKLSAGAQYVTAKQTSSWLSSWPRRKPRSQGDHLLHRYHHEGRTSRAGTSPVHRVSMKMLAFSAKEHSYGWDHHLGLKKKPKTECLQHHSSFKNTAQTTVVT